MIPYAIYQGCERHITPNIQQLIQYLAAFIFYIGVARFITQAEVGLWSILTASTSSTDVFTTLSLLGMLAASIQRFWRISFLLREETLERNVDLRVKPELGTSSSNLIQRIGTHPMQSNEYQFNVAKTLFAPCPYRCPEERRGEHLPPG